MESGSWGRGTSARTPGASVHMLAHREWGTEEQLVRLHPNTQHTVRCKTWGLSLSHLACPLTWPAPAGRPERRLGVLGHTHGAAARARLAWRSRIGTAVVTVAVGLALTQGTNSATEPWPAPTRGLPASAVCMAGQWLGRVATLSRPYGYTWQASSPTPAASAATSLQGHTCSSGGQVCHATGAGSVAREGTRWVRETNEDTGCGRMWGGGNADSRASVGRGPAKQGEQ